MEKSMLTPTQRFAASALFAMALHQSQRHQTRPLNSLLPLDEEPVGDGASIAPDVSVSDAPQLWIHENSGLLWSVCRSLGVDDQAWHGLKETAGSSSQVRHHVGSFLTLLSEEGDGASSENTNKELALTKAVDAMVLSMETSPLSSEDTESYAYEIKCRKKFSKVEEEAISDVAVLPSENIQISPKKSSENIQISPKKPTENIQISPKKPTENIQISPKKPTEEEASDASGSRTTEKPMEEKPMEEGRVLSYQRKVTVLYELLSACIAHNNEDHKKSSHSGNGYDARHRVALRLLATWFDIEWIKMEALEITVACSLMNSVDGESTVEKEIKDTESPGAKWKRGGIIGAAALTGGTLMAITGGLAAPAFAGGLGALAPTLGSLVPAIGASGFAAAAGATGSIAGSVTIAASFGAAGAGYTGSKVATRTGGIDEFEFKTIGENHNQGRLAVGILISGLVLEDEDFLMPWEGLNENLERYVLKWESKYLIEVSSAIREWINSKLAIEIMKEGGMMTVSSMLLGALSFPTTLLSTTDLIDSKWAIAVDRSDKAGKLLAEVLLKRLQGNRPVTLIGFSLGARVIFKCLQCLAEIGGDNAGLVERVVLLGAPISIQGENWDEARKMVPGRFVNAYSTNDWTLGIAFRASLFSQGLAGIQQVEVPGVENVDVTGLVEGHASYLWRTKTIVEHLELDSYYPVFRTTHTQLKEVKNSET